MDNRARLVIAEHLGVPMAEVVDGASFRELGADSLDIVSLTMALEETFDLRISEEQAEACVTVGDAISFLRMRLEHEDVPSDTRFAELSPVGG